MRASLVREIITRRLHSFYIEIPVLRPGTVGAYAFAVVSVGIATVLRVALDPYLEGAQFITFYPAIIITTLISGFGAGFLSAVLSTAAADFFILSPRFSFVPETSADWADLLLFGPLASYLVILIARMRFAIEREQVEASKERLQSALDAAKLGSWQYDAPHRVLSWDARGKEIFATAENRATVEELMNLIHPDDAERVLAAIFVALNPAQPQRLPTQFRLRRRNGKVRWVETQGLARLEGAGRERKVASFIGTVQDITERKEREEQMQLLVREVNHRAKNVLSVADAMAHQTVANSPEDYVERVSERIRALAAQQDLLVRSEWYGVEIVDLVRVQLSHFADLIGSRIAMRGAKLRLNPASAQAIGLAFHELATNAAKYGALSTETGRIDVGWGADGETFTMSWTERDGPPVSPPQRRGFGTVVMKEMAERSLDGKVDLEYAPSGVTWRLTCPVVNALEHRQRQR
jgi:PAS domain S-box-containing protein